MKSIFFVSGAALLIVACQQPKSNPVATDWAQENLKGSVKEIVSDTYLTDSTGKIAAMDSCCNYVERFDKKGYTVSYITKDSKDSVQSAQKITHNDNGYLTEVMITKNGKQLQRITFDLGSDSSYKLVQFYDSTNKLSSYYRDVKLNSFGEPLEGQEHHADSALSRSFLVGYDSIYNIGGETRDSTGKIIYKNNIVLNDKHDPSSMTAMNMRKDSTINTTTTYSYDAWDKQGNWTQQTIHKDKNGQPVTTIIKRTITYYQ